MNKRRLAVIAKWLEAGTPHKKGVDGFDMRDFKGLGDCGTTCCIGGAAVQFFGDPNREDFENDAKMLLGLDQQTAGALFFPMPIEGWEGISPSWAARVIRGLIRTGNVDWIANEKVAA